MTHQRPSCSTWAPQYNPVCCSLTCKIQPHSSRLSYTHWVHSDQMTPRYSRCSSFSSAETEKWFTQIYRALYGDAMFVLIQCAPSRPKTTRNICHWSCYESMNSSLEELIISTITVKKAKFPKMSHSYSLFNSWLGPRVNQCRKSWEIQSYSITERRTLFKRKFVEILVLSCSKASWK